MNRSTLHQDQLALKIEKKEIKKLPWQNFSNQKLLFEFVENRYFNDYSELKKISKVLAFRIEFGTSQTRREIFFRVSHGIAITEAKNLFTLAGKDIPKDAEEFEQLEVDVQSYVPTWSNQ